MSLSSKLNAVFHLSKFVRHYGPFFPITRIGRLNVFDYSFRFCARPSLYYLQETIAGRVYEPATCHYIIKHYANRTITFLDIGAYYGFFSSLLGAMNPENQVHAFEPNPVYFRTLAKNWNMNCRNGGCHAVALSDSEGTIPFKDSSMKVSESETALRVPTIRFDEWRKSNPVTPDLIKLDVHGSEGKVLFGMQDLLREGGFEICFELHPQEIIAEYTLKDIISLLYDTGWEMSELPDFRGTASPEPVRISNEKRSILQDPDKWTQREMDSRRMFICKKGSDQH